MNKQHSFTIRHTLAGITALCILFTVLSFSGCGVTQKRPASTTTESLSPAETAPQGSAPASIGVKPVSAEDLAQALRAEAPESGFADAMTELVPVSTSVVDGDTYCRMQQYYRGIPVYGRSAVCAVNAAGEEIARVGNLQDINASFVEFPPLSAEAAVEACRDYFQQDGSADELSLVVPPDEEGLCVYNLFGHSPCLAWRVTVSRGGACYELLLAYADGEVLLCQPLVIGAGEFVTASGEDSDGASVSFPAYRNEGEDVFRLMDPTRNITVYDAQGGKMTAVFHVRSQKDGKEYKFSVRHNGWIGFDQDVARENVTSYPYSEISPVEFLGLSMEAEAGSPELLVSTSPDLTWRDGHLVSAMDRTVKAYDFFFRVLGRRGPDNANCPISVAANDRGCEAYSAYSLSLPADRPAILLSLLEDLTLDSVGHEYTHSVQNFTADLVYQDDGGALDEALADIFGELIEDYWNDGELNGNCDWIHGSRNLENPTRSSYDCCEYLEARQPCPYLAQTGGSTHDYSCKLTHPYPSSVRGDGFYTGTEDHGGAHWNSTVISHAAYLMWNGIDGTEAKRLTTGELAELWYRTMLMMPADCNFSQCRNLTELAARTMHLTEEQQACVGEAFGLVGIPAQPRVDYTVGAGAVLTVLDEDGNPYQNYDCLITGEIVPAHTLGGGSYAQRFSGSSTDPMTLPPERGYYTVVLTDLSTSGESVTFRLMVDPENDGRELSVATAFRDDALVLDAYALDRTFDIYGEQRQCSYRIPRIRLEGSGIDAINQEIYERWSEEIHTAVSDYENNGMGDLLGLEYSWNVHGDILSLVIHSKHYMDPSSAHYVYTVSVSNRRAASLAEILEAGGIGEEDYLELVKQALASEFLHFGHDMREYGLPDELYRTYLLDTISEDNLRSAKPYFNVDGHLCILGLAFVPVQAGCVECMADLEDFEISPYYEEAMAELSTPAAGGEELFGSFLAAKGYRNNSYGVSASAYCFYDLDQDGREELLISGAAFMEQAVVVYVCDANSGQVVEAGTVTGMGGFVYSPEAKTIAAWWRNMNNGNILYAYSVWELKGKTMEVVANFTYETATDQYTSDYGSEILSEDTVKRYLGDTVNFEFTPLR